jgi:tRNA modification GTPase
MIDAQSADTIFALASAPGRAGVGVIRISGPAAGTVLRAVCGLADLPSPRRAIRCRMVDPADGAPLDDGLALWFPGPSSFTGEDVAELHIHGGRATIEAVAGVLARHAGLRLAEPGEFSKRAFLAGKIDLTEAEAIADLVDAGTDAQRRQALAQLGGGLGARLDSWRAELIDILAHTEAWIDFPDEDLPAGIAAAARARIAGLAAEIRGFLDDNRRGERLRDGLQIVILGAPNAGKSSLLNAIAARPAAIVSEIAGTTRDVIEVHLDLGGWPVTLADTAGLRDAADDIEAEGVRRALDRAAAADLRLVVFDGTQPADAPSLAQLDGRGFEESGSEGAGLEGRGRLPALAVVSKIDLGGETPDGLEGHNALRVSAPTGEGLADLLAALEATAAELLADASDDIPLTRLRHRTALADCAAALARAAGPGIGSGTGSESESESEPGNEADFGAASELVAEDVRLAARALGRVTGRVDVEDLLDVIFSDFCIGK